MICTLVVLMWNTRLPSLAGRSRSEAFTDTEDTKLGRSISPRAKAHLGLSGVFPLPSAQDAFAARILLTRAAERSLDVQYYIWQGDMTGMMMFQALYEAAERGVRVRLLLDDNNTSGLDSILAFLNSHPMIEVRLFNPFIIRRPRLVNFLVDFSRLNRRMHNKSFTADNQATIIGGRNVGDEYFGATDDVLFADLDVIAVGPVVRDVSTDFDRYWASESSYPAEQVLAPLNIDRAQNVQHEILASKQHSAAAEYLQAIESLPFVRELVEGTLELEWARTEMVSDSPAKGLGQAGIETLMPHKLRSIVGEPQSHLELVSPYFVPTKSGSALFSDLAKEDVKIRILTNSFEATDVTIVHSGYSKWRKKLLTAGITLYELRSRSPTAEARWSRLAGSSGSSASSLHAKTFSVDSSRVFIGSYNFDPRSAKLNTEMGFVIESPRLAKDIESVFNHRVTENAYEVALNEEGELYWIERREGRVYRHETEPGTTILNRFFLYTLSRLPIDWLL